MYMERMSLTANARNYSKKIPVMPGISTRMCTDRRWGIQKLGALERVRWGIHTVSCVGCFFRRGDRNFIGNDFTCKRISSMSRQAALHVNMESDCLALCKRTSVLNFRRVLLSKKFTLFCSSSTEAMIRLKSMPRINRTCA